jgi:hypothetical protein
MSQEYEDSFTVEGLQYLGVAIIFAMSNDDVGNMPKTMAALEVLYDKIERMYEKE